jgi:transposase InsO family protein
MNRKRHCKAPAQAYSKVSKLCRLGNCHDNACAESFFSLLKKERIRRRTHPTRELQNPMCSIILNYFAIQHDAMEITVTCHPWSLKITILGTKQVFRKMGAHHKPNNNVILKVTLFEQIYRGHLIKSRLFE